jgi:cell division protein FtsB
MTQGILILSCLIGFVFVVLLQAFLVHRMGHLRHRAAEAKKQYGKIRSIGNDLTEEVHKLAQGIASQGATIHKLEEESTDLKRKLKEEDRAQDEHSALQSSSETDGSGEI